MNDRSLELWSGTAKAMRIAKSAHIAWADIRSKRRFPRLVAVRRAIAKELRRTSELSMPEIARILGRKNHTSILHYLRS